jgi:DNA mismatch endonuclease (patch repair protein)
MSANRPKGTQPELILREALSQAGVRGYRLNWTKAPGRPDLAFPGKNIAIFVNGCFWHRCPYCQPSVPKTHTDFWMRKFENNVRRDKQKAADLRRAGWKVLTVWECRLKNNPGSAVRKIRKLLSDAEGLSV